jgi:glycerophosphoryl diester phosphodiesterase
MKNQKPKLSSPRSFWDSVTGPVMVAHRGGDAAGIEKENSLAAFQAAYDLGYRWFETDVVTTKDGKLLAIHGRGYQRRPNKDLPSRLAIQKMTYAEARQNVTVGGELPLLLEELLDAFPDVQVFVDPKTFKTAPVLADLLISRPSDLGRVCVGSFYRRNTTLVSRSIKAATGRDISCGAIGIWRSLLLIWTARLSLPTFWISRYLRATKTDTLYLPYRLLLNRDGQKIVETAHKLQLRLAVYTPNDEASIQRCAKLGVDAIMSDRLVVLKRALASK